MSKIALFLSIIAVSVAAVIGYTAYSWVTTKKTVQLYCTRVSAGMSIDTARQMASEEGLAFKMSKPADFQGPSVAMVTSTGVMGRVVCTVEYDQRKVTGERLDFYD